MKYKLTTNTKRWAGVTLYQIEYLKSSTGIPKGVLGGWIECESNLSQEGNAYVSGNACVYGNAHVSGDAHISRDAHVYGNAYVYGNAHVSGDARVSGDAHVYGNAYVYGNACVSGNAHVSGNACVYGNACVCAKADFTKGSFIGGDDSWKITNITDKTGTTYWKNQYVLGEYEITPIEEPTITLTDDELLAECQRRGVSIKITK